MNATTKDIANRFDLTIEDALKVQLILDEEHLVDSSEATQREINAAYDEAHAIWLAGGADNYYLGKGN